MPSIIGRKKIIEYYIDKINHEDIDIDRLASITTDFTGSDIKNMINLAILSAVRNDRKNAN